MLNKIKTAIFALCLCLFGVFPAFAATPMNVVIELESEQNDSDRLYDPRSEADYKLTLKNKLGAAWVRVKFTLSAKGIDTEFTDDDLHIVDADKWVKRGDYWYYTEKAAAYTDYLVVDGIQIPDANIAEDGAYVAVIADADAVSYSQFRPDFSKDEPWKDAQIKSSSHSGGSGSSSNTKKYTKTEQIHMYSSPQESAEVSTGKWILEDTANHVWKYQDTNGNYAKSGWIYVENPYSTTGDKNAWFHFGDDGVMTFGWLKTDEQVWYYTHETSDGNLGMLIKGWHDDKNDGRKYYLDTKTGIMLSGWQEIDGAKYYFTPYEEARQQSWFYHILGDTKVGVWLYEKMNLRSYGSMYQAGEVTPDGTVIGEGGAA